VTNAPVELRLSGITAGYGAITALSDIDLTVDLGEVVAVLGANGAGKSTLLKTIAGVVPPRSGTIQLGGTRLNGLRPAQIVRHGIALVPEGRQVFASLTVLDNLRCGAFVRHRGGLSSDLLNEVFDLFPRLNERRRQLAGTLSGGEQQMLAIARALLSEPRVLLLDEPSMGLAPVVVEQIFAALGTIVATNNVTVLVVEQSAKIALEFASRAYLLEVGRVIGEGASGEMDERAVRAAYLGAEVDGPGRA
jgi:branched-chain amino acid transport system ATP-binding protein